MYSLLCVRYSTANEMTDHLYQFLDKIHLIEKKTNNNEACIVTKLFHHQIRPEKSIDKTLITK